MHWTLELALVDPYGKRTVKAIQLDEFTMQEHAIIKPPEPFMVGPRSFDEVIQVMKRREFRKDLFKQEATRLGHALAEYMEDVEGWHGVERQEKLNDQG